MKDKIDNNKIDEQDAAIDPVEEVKEVASLDVDVADKVDVVETITPTAPSTVTPSTPAIPTGDNFFRGPRGARGQGGRPAGRGGRGGDRRGGPRREPRAKPEFDQKMIDIRRVTRVSAGGRRFSFAVAVVIGDKKGKVGVGTGKGSDTSLAVEKAVRDAKNNLVIVPLTKTGSIPHAVFAKYCSARVEMKPAVGKGVVAGSSVRDVVVLAGITDINAKLRSGTKNKLNNAQAAVKALASFKKNKRPTNTISAN